MMLLAGLGGLIAIHAFIVFSSIFDGYVLCLLWQWFIVPVFHLPTLSIPYAIGLALVVSYLTSHNGKSKNYDEDKGTGHKFTLAICNAILKPLIALFFGWIVHLFV